MLRFNWRGTLNYYREHQTRLGQAFLIGAIGALGAGWVMWAIDGGPWIWQGMFTAALVAMFGGLLIILDKKGE
jgi:hypothetical protein